MYISVLVCKKMTYIVANHINHLHAFIPWTLI